MWSASLVTNLCINFINIDALIFFELNIILNRAVLINLMMIPSPKITNGPDLIILLIQTR